MSEHDNLIEAIKAAWNRYPEMRMGQLIFNASRLGDPNVSLFYVSDLALFRGLKRSASDEQDSGGGW